MKLDSHNTLTSNSGSFFHSSFEGLRHVIGHDGIYVYRIGEVPDLFPDRAEGYHPIMHYATANGTAK